MKKNALILAKDLYEKMSWMTALSVCNEYFDTVGTKTSQYKELDLDQEEELALIRIDCQSQLIDLRDFRLEFNSDEESEIPYALEEDEYGNEMIPLAVEKHRPMARLLYHQILYLFDNYLDDLPVEEVAKKILYYSWRIAPAQRETYRQFRDFYYSQIPDEFQTDEETEQKPEQMLSNISLGYNFFQTFLFICFVFFTPTEITENDEVFNDLLKDNIYDRYKEDLRVTERLLEQKVNRILGKINELSDDFPCFTKEDVLTVSSMYSQMSQLCRTIMTIYPTVYDESELAKKKAECLKRIVSYYHDIMELRWVAAGNIFFLSTGENRRYYYQEILSMESKIREYDSDYSHPKISVIDAKNKVNTGGCYVATCVYGSYDCPQVWTLRRYRDYTLAKSWYGRAFIRSYYAVSPTLVKWFGNTGWFKKMWQGKLDRMVAKLQAKGVESTPYKDREDL